MLQDNFAPPCVVRLNTLMIGTETRNRWYPDP